jgi:hypothetical protein
MAQVASRIDRRRRFLPSPHRRRGRPGCGRLCRRRFAATDAGQAGAKKRTPAGQAPPRHRPTPPPAGGSRPRWPAASSCPPPVAHRREQTPGTLDWIVNFVQPDHALEGFASQVSAVPGDDVALFVNTTARAVQVQAYRMGYYQGLGGRLVYQSDMVAAGPQPAPWSASASAR